MSKDFFFQSQDMNTWSEYLDQKLPEKASYHNIRIILNPLNSIISISSLFKSFRHT